MTPLHHRFAFLHCKAIPRLFSHLWLPLICSGLFELLVCPVNAERVCNCSITPECCDADNMGRNRACPPRSRAGRSERRDLRQAITPLSYGKRQPILQVKRLIGQQQVEENQDLRDEYVALLEMSSSLQQQTVAWNQQHSLFQTPERSLVQYLLRSNGHCQLSWLICIAALALCIHHHPSAGRE